MKMHDLVRDGPPADVDPRRQHDERGATHRRHRGEQDQIGQMHFAALRLSDEECWARDVVIDETVNSIAANERPRHAGDAASLYLAQRAAQALKSIGY